MRERIVESVVSRGFEHYVELVAEAVGADPDAWACRSESPREAYIAVDRDIHMFPGREVALLWNEESGWAVGVETRSGEDIILLGYLGGDLVPAPSVVAAFTEHFGEKGLPGQWDHPRGSGRSVDESLRRYALTRIPLDEIHVDEIDAAAG